MLRKPKSLYVGKRSKTLIKVKRFYDIDATVTKHLPGKGRNKNVTGALGVVLSNGVEFKVGSGLSDEDRKNPPPIGYVIIIKYQELGKDTGVPRFPTFIGMQTTLMQYGPILVALESDTKGTNVDVIFAKTKCMSIANRTHDRHIMCVGN